VASKTLKRRTPSKKPRPTANTRTSSKPRSRRSFVIDVHAHWTSPPEVVAFTRGRTIDSSIPPGAPEHLAALDRKWTAEFQHKQNDLDARLREMDRTGVDMQVVTTGILRTCTYFAPPEVGLKMDRLINERTAEMVAKAKALFGVVDIAVSNVSMRRKQPFLDISLEDWHSTLNTNLNSCFYMARAVIPDMKARGWGRLIHISGIDGFAGHIPTRAHNIVCKAGMHAFSKALAVEFGEYGITANTVSPGSLDTTRDWSQYPENWLEMRLSQIPVHRLGTADEIAAACVYLASESAGFVTGQVIHVNGGQYMY